MRKETTALLVALCLIGAIAMGQAAFAAVQSGDWTSPPNSEVLFTEGSAGNTVSDAAATYTFRQGAGAYAGSTDTVLRSDRAGTNYGASALLTVQADNWILSTLRFDLASIPPGTTVQSARLELYLANKNDSWQFTLSAYKLLRAWNAGQANWTQATSATRWAAEGAGGVGTDREGTAQGTVPINAPGQTYSLDVTKAVQAWVNSPASNYGLVLRGDGSNATEFRFASAEHSTANWRPRLVVTTGGPLVSRPPATSSPTATRTSTPAPPGTNTPVPPTATATIAVPPVASTNTPMPTATAVPPTPTATTPPPTPTAPAATPAPTGGIWKPAMNTPWQWMIDHPLDLNNAKDMGLVDPNGIALSAPPPLVYDIDGFMNSKATVDSLHTKGKKVICYLDVGAYETYRPDAYRFPASVIGNPDQGWNGSYWLDIRRTDILGPIMRDRMQMCKDKGFDAIEPDEIDGYSNSSGFPLTYQDQINYNKFIADMAHSMGMSIGLKGDIDQVKDLWPYFDWTLNEECFQYGECGLLQPFISAGKAVFQVEYQTSTGAFCSTANSMNFNAMKMPLSLNGGRWPCR